MIWESQPISVSTPSSVIVSGSASTVSITSTSSLSNTSQILRQSLGTGEKGGLGIIYKDSRGKWHVVVNISNNSGSCCKQHHVGKFDTEDEARSVHKRVSQPTYILRFNLSFYDFAGFGRCKQLW